MTHPEEDSDIRCVHSISYTEPCEECTELLYLLCKRQILFGDVFETQQQANKLFRLNMDMMTIHKKEDEE